MEDISVTIGGRAILRDVSLDAAPGEIVAIMGPSGAGKTTLLRAIAQLVPVRAGTVHFGSRSYRSGTEVHRRTADDLYPTVTYVAQNYSLWPHMSNMENLVFPFRGHAAPLADIEALSARLGITDVLRRRPAECSHGQRQRIALVRALVLRPLYLLLDEITSALDATATHTVGELLCDYAARGAVIVLVTHDIRFAELTCATVVEMSEGGCLLADRAPLRQSPHER